MYTCNMKKSNVIVIVLLIASTKIISANVTTISSKRDVNLSAKNDIKSERVSFWIKGTGSKGINVNIGIGSQVGSGSCCTTITPSGTNSFTGNVGDVVYDSDNKRIITKIYTELKGTTIDLKQYY
jgi:hypothetical protein